MGRSFPSSVDCILFGLSSSVELTPSVCMQSEDRQEGWRGDFMDD